YHARHERTGWDSLRDKRVFNRSHLNIIEQSSRAPGAQRPPGACGPEQDLGVAPDGATLELRPGAFASGPGSGAPPIRRAELLRLRPAESRLRDRVTGRGHGIH